MTGWWLAAVALLGATAWLAACETVADRLPMVRALRLDEEGEAGSTALLWLCEHRVTTRNVILLGTITVRTGFVVCAWVIGGPIGVVVSVALSMIVGEVAPRTSTLRHLESTGLRVAPGLRALVRATSPVARLTVDLGRMLGTRTDVVGPYPSDDDVRELLVEEDDDDSLDDEERAMITAVLELGDTVVREIMVPRPDMITVDADDELRSVIQTVIEHGRSRIPVVRGNGDDIVGIVHAKDVLARLATRPGSGVWSDLVRDAAFVPETKRVDDLLTELRDEAIHQAIVIDEYGAVTGLVTIEDVLEEIVGEIVDEHDTEEERIQLLPSGAIRVDARLLVDDLDDLLGTELPDDDWDTVGGLVFGLLGHVPAVGETVELDGLRFTAEQVQGRRRVARVLVQRLSSMSSAEAQTE